MENEKKVQAETEQAFAAHLGARLLRVIERAEAEERRTLPRGIHAKLAAAMGEMVAVAKRGWNENQRYRFVQAGDLADAAREILAKYGIDVEPCPVGEPQVVREVTTRSGTIHHIYRVLIDWWFTDGETGEKAGPYRFAGEGMDSGDKGVYKAYTGSLKYLLKLKFLIPDTGDDLEVANEHDRDVADEREPQRGLAGAKEQVRRNREERAAGGNGGDAASQQQQPDPDALDAAEYKTKVRSQLVAIGMSELEATAWVVGVIGKDRLTRAWTPAERQQIDAGLALLIAKAKQEVAGKGARP